MSFASKTLQGFSGLIAVATVPLTLSITQPDQIKVELNKTIQVGGGKESQPEQQILQQMKKILDNGSGTTVAKEKEAVNSGYFVLEGLDKHILFVFMQTNSLNTPFFFYYHWRGKTTEERIYQVKKITYNGWRNVQLHLSNSSTQNLPTNAPTWMRKWRKGSEFQPEKQCRITAIKENSEKNVVYKLICQNPNPSTGEKEWEQKVTLNQITFSEQTSSPKK